MSRPRYPLLARASRVALASAGALMLTLTAAPARADADSDSDSDARRWQRPQYEEASHRDRGRGYGKRHDRRGRYQQKRYPRHRNEGHYRPRHNQRHDRHQYRHRQDRHRYDRHRDRGHYQRQNRGHHRSHRGFAVPRHLERHLYRPYYFDRLYYRPHRHHHTIYRFPVYDAYGGVDYHPYAYCEGEYYGRGRFTFRGPHLYIDWSF